MMLAPSVCTTDCKSFGQMSDIARSYPLYSFIMIFLFSVYLYHSFDHGCGRDVCVDEKILGPIHSSND